jgi:hypothetical protein
MADPKFPYVKWRGGRPRAVHGPRQRALGFVDADLRHPPLDDKGRPVGRWFTMEEAAAFSDKRVTEVAAARAAGQAKPKPERKRETIDHLLDDWTRSNEFKTNALATQRSYRKAVQAILYKPMTREQAAELGKKERAAKVLGVLPPVREREAIADVTPSSLGRPELRAFFNYVKAERGHHIGDRCDRRTLGSPDMGPGEHTLAARAQSSHRHGVRSSRRTRGAGDDAGILRLGRGFRRDRTAFNRRQLLSCAVHRSATDRPDRYAGREQSRRASRVSPEQDRRARGH